jgi:hypothetical protein
MSPTLRALFGVVAFLPLIAVGALSVYLTSMVPDGPLADPENWVRHGHVAQPLLVAGAALVATAFLQIAIGVFVFVHCQSRRDLSGSEKIVWPMACLLVGSIALPIFFFTMTKPRSPRP